MPFAMLQNYPKQPKPSPAAPGRHSGRGRVFLHVRAGCHPWLWSVCRRFKLAVCQASKLPETAQTLPCSSCAPLTLRQTLRALLSRLPPVALVRLPAATLLFRKLQACRLPGFKTARNCPNPSLQLLGANQAAADSSCTFDTSVTPLALAFFERPMRRLQACKTCPRLRASGVSA